MRKLGQRMVLAALLGWGLVMVAGALDVPLKYESYSARTQTFRPYGNQNIRLSDQPKAKGLKLPKFKNKRPLYGEMEFCGKKIAVALDGDQDDGKTYNIIYLDANGNGDLTDDAPMKGVVRDNRGDNMRLVEFTEPLNLKIDQGGKTLPYSLTARVYGFEGNFPSSNQHEVHNVNFSMMANCAWTGEFDLEGQHYRLALGDSNCNGLFNETLNIPPNQRVMSSSGQPMIYPRGDQFYSTTEPQLSFSDNQVLGQYLALSNNLYKVDINIPQEKLTLTPVAETLAPLALPSGTQSIELYTEDQKNCVMAVSPGASIMVPEGKWRPLSYTMARTDEQGDGWQVAARASEDTPWIEVKVGANAKIEYGEPFRPRVGIPEWVRQNLRTAAMDQIQLSFYVMDRSRMELSDLRHVSGNKTSVKLNSQGRPLEPKYKITTAEGEKVTQGQFEYG